MKSKKSQILILSAMFMFLLLLLSYSLETQNSYKLYLDENSVLENLIYESCILGQNSNGSNLDARFSEFETNVYNYCSNTFGYNCSINITKQLSAPSNASELNYTHYDYEIDNFTSSFMNYSAYFTC